MDFVSLLPCACTCVCPSCTIVLIAICASRFCRVEWVQSYCRKIPDNPINYIIDLILAYYRDLMLILYYLIILVSLCEPVIYNAETVVYAIQSVNLVTNKIKHSMGILSLEDAQYNNGPLTLIVNIYYYQLVTHTHTTQRVHVHKDVFHVHSFSYIHTCLGLVQIANEWQGCWARNAKALKVLVGKVFTPIFFIV